MSKEKTKENQQGRIIEFEHFDLKSFKVNKEGVTLSYYNLLFPNIEQTINSKIVSHPDLQTEMDQLQIHFATRIGLLEGWNFSRDNCKDKPEILQFAIDMHDAAKERCRITGYSFVGEGEILGVNIKAYVKFPEKGGTGMSSGKITFSDNVLGTESEIEAICEDIKKEVYKFAFQSKKAQQTIDTEQENPDLFEEPETDE